MYLRYSEKSQIKIPNEIVINGQYFIENHMLYPTPIPRIIYLMLNRLKTNHKIDYILFELYFLLRNSLCVIYNDGHACGQRAFNKV